MALGPDEIGTRWDWDPMDLRPDGFGTRWDWDPMDLGPDGIGARWIHSLGGEIPWSTDLGPGEPLTDRNRIEGNSTRISISSISNSPPHGVILSLLVFVFVAFYVFCWE